MTDRQIAMLALLVGALALVGLVLHARRNPLGFPHGMSA